MRRIFAILLLGLMLSACGAPEAAPAEAEQTETPRATSAAMEALRQRVEAEDAFCGIFYLGNVPEGADPLDWLREQGAAEVYPVLGELTASQVVQRGGPELYCLIPREGAAVTVQEWICNEENHYQGVPGETLYQETGGEPVLLQCNEDWIIPNLHLHIINSDGAELEYEPCLSMCDGSVDLPVAQPVMDLTQYEAIR